MRDAIFRFIAGLSNTQLGYRYPKWVITFRYLLFPIRTYLYVHSPYRYDVERGVFYFSGYEFSEQAMEAFARNEVGKAFRIIKREDGVITIEYLHGV